MSQIQISTKSAKKYLNELLDIKGLKKDLINNNFRSVFNRCEAYGNLYDDYEEPNQDEYYIPATCMMAQMLLASGIDFLSYMDRIPEELMMHAQTDLVRSLHIPSNIKIIGECAFSEAYIKSITFDEGLEEILDGAFELTYIKKVKLPRSLKFVGKGIFSGDYDDSGVETIYCYLTKEDLDKEEFRNLKGQAEQIININTNEVIG